MTLNELREGLERIKREAFNPGLDTDADALEQALLDLTQPGGQIEQKLDGYLEMIKKFTTLAEAKKSRADELFAQAKSLSARASWLKSCVLSFIQSFPKFNGVKLVAGTPRAVANPPRVEVFDLELLPESMVNVVSTPNVKAIKEALVSGEEVPGAKIGELTFHLRF